MSTIIKIDPVTRIEGHLKIEVTVETVNNVQQVIDAKSSGTMFRGFERILLNHDPLDAPHITQRICGVCPISHGMASCKTLENAFGAVPPANGRIMRNLVLGSNFIQSHILHFYHLAALDYINTRGILDMAPWSSRYETPDMVGGELAGVLVGHYVKALEMRRKAHQMGAIFGAKLPCAPTFVPGGCTEAVTSAKISDFRKLLNDAEQLRSFIDTVYIPDVQAVASLFPQYLQIGRGCGNLLAYGVFDLDTNDTNKLLARGRYTDNVLQPVNIADISEDVLHSWYSSPSGLNPAGGQTEPNHLKPGAYSWIKAPRYNGKAHEVGPLARMWVNGDYRNGISVIDRLAARAFEAKKVADAMVGWLNELIVGGSTYSYKQTPLSATGFGLTEAPRGALGHWADITNGRLSRYQVITPTAWNCSPMDDLGQYGPVEQALIGTPVADLQQPIELLRVIHSFDPCLACSVHLLRPDQKKGVILQTPVLVG
jgi:hydrogenase large subunit